MAKRTTNGGTAAPGRSRTGNYPKAGNGEARPALAVNRASAPQVSESMEAGANG